MVLVECTLKCFLEEKLILNFVPGLIRPSLNLSAFIGVFSGCLVSPNTSGGAPRALRESPTTTSIFQSKYHLENLFSRSCQEPGIFCSFSPQNPFILRNFGASIPKWDLWLPPVAKRIGVRIYGQIPFPACFNTVC